MSTFLAEDKTLRVRKKAQPAVRLRDYVRSKKAHEEMVKACQEADHTPLFIIPGTGKINDDIPIWACQCGARKVESM